MTAGRRGGQHVYDLTERLLPGEILSQRKLSVDEAVKGLVHERHRAVGLLRPTAPQEVWAFNKVGPAKKAAYDEFERTGELIPVEVEGMAFYAIPELLDLVARPAAAKVRFIAPLDQLVWDRKAVAHVFGFDYLWEIYVPEAKRRWGYYVLPVLFGDRFVARAEFWCRNGLLEMRVWHWEPGDLTPSFWDGLHSALDSLMAYCGASRSHATDSVDRRVMDCLELAAQSRTR